MIKCEYCSEQNEKLTRLTCCGVLYCSKCLVDLINCPKCKEIVLKDDKSNHERLITKEKESFAKLLIADNYYLGRVVLQDYEKSFDYYTKAASQEENIDVKSIANYSLAIMYKMKKCDFLSLEQSVVDEKIFHHLEIAANAGHSISQFHLGRLYFDKGDKINAFKYFELGAKQGHPVSLFMVGTCYMSGDGVEVDLTKSFQCFFDAAKKNHAESVISLAAAYMEGKGVTQSMFQSIYWFKKFINDNKDNSKSPSFKLAEENLKNIMNVIDKYCTCCGKKEKMTLMCGKCQSVFYCNSECQAKHWKNGHKQECQIFNTVKKV